MSTDVETKVNKNAEVTVIDESGRKIVIKKPNRLQIVNYRIACGDKRDALQEEIFVLPWVQSIDGEKIPVPVALIDVKNLIQMLDNEGYMAVLNEIVKQLPSETEESASKKGV